MPKINWKFLILKDSNLFGIFLAKTWFALQHETPSFSCINIDQVDTFVAISVEIDQEVFSSVFYTYIHTDINLIKTYDLSSGNPIKDILYII